MAQLKRSIFMTGLIVIVTGCSNLNGRNLTPQKINPQVESTTKSNSLVVVGGDPNFIVQVVQKSGKCGCPY